MNPPNLRQMHGSQWEFCNFAIFLKRVSLRFLLVCSHFLEFQNEAWPRLDQLNGGFDAPPTFHLALLNFEYSARQKCILSFGGACIDRLQDSLPCSHSASDISSHTVPAAVLTNFLFRSLLSFLVSSTTPENEAGDFIMVERMQTQNALHMQTFESIVFQINIYQSYGINFDLLQLFIITIGQSAFQP